MPTTPRDRLCNMILLGDAFTAERFRDISAGATERLAARVLAEPEGDQALGDFVLYVVALDTLMEAAKHINTLAKSRDLKTEIKSVHNSGAGFGRHARRDDALLGLPTWRGQATEGRHEG
jgi:hypothetical protein